jgi:O-methyltransferase involved in polyketide biosynthesis
MTPKEAGEGTPMKSWIIDTTRPSNSRIYDYVLGGHHNFEVDRAAAEQLLQVFPSYPHWARLNRWFLQMVAEQWAVSEHRCILDLGSGIPTQGYFHTLAPDARVLYTDKDPVAVAFARHMIGDHPSVVYLQADVREPGPILEAAEQLFGGERRVAIGCIGITYFINDESLARLMRALHDWAAPGSIMALTQTHGQAVTRHTQAAADLFKRADVELFPRDAAAMRRLITPWQVRACRPLATWLGVQHLIEEADHEGTNVEMFGMLLDREG